MKKFILMCLCFMMFLSFSKAEAVSYLNDIKVMQSAYNTVVNITFTEPVNFTEGQLAYNNKIYLDFSDTIIREPIQANVGTNYVSGVRSAQNAVNPEYITRVVFDMDKITAYKIQTYDNKSINVIFEEVDNTKVTISNDNKENESIEQDTNIKEEVTSRGPTIRPNADEITNNQKSKIIVVDAGHGGKDPGAIFGSIQEKSLNLDIAKRLRKLLVAEGYQVIMTRSTDEFIELTERADIANRNNADLFISVHNNSMPDNYRGTMTLYSTRDVNNEFSSKDLAETIQKNMEKSLASGSIGARERTDLVVLNKTTMPAIIAEVACMSNNQELNLLKTAQFRQAAAQGICNAILELDF